MLAKSRYLRVTFLSGDVHCAAVGVLKTYVKGKKEPDVPPAMDYRYMINVVTSKSSWREHAILSFSDMC